MGRGRWRGFLSTNYDIGAKPFRKKKILHSDQFSMEPGSAVGGKLKREKKTSQTSASQASL